MDLIHDIRESYGLDIHVDNARVSSAIHYLTENLERTSKSLSEDLYSKATHFVLEFIQNADDNTYLENVTPTLIIELKDRQMTIQCNETGLIEANVRALCSIGKSTKNDRSGYIGEKGIGFKSAFAIADTVHVVSGPYKFMFDKRTKLGMIVPTWSDDVVAPEGWTLFRLGLSAQTQHGELVSHLEDIQPSLLLFLRRIHQITLTIESKTFTIEKIVLQDGVTRVQRSGNGTTRSDDYIISKHTVDTSKCQEMEEKRKGVFSSEMILAFPVTKDELPVIDDQNVHAFLPLRPFGFTFIIQADFLTASNREDVLANRAWNQNLRDAISVAFAGAILELQQRHALACTWIRYMPLHIADSFFSPVPDNLISQLQQLRIIVCEDEVLRLPSEVLMLPSVYRDGRHGAPLIPGKFITSKHYLSDNYNLAVDTARLKALGVEQMTESYFLQGLSSMQLHNSLSAQPDTWWETVCAILRRTLPKQRALISHLKLVPLVDGSWDTVSEDIYLQVDLNLVDIPQDLQLRLVKHLDHSSSHFRLLQDLGIKVASFDMIAKRIQVLHRRSAHQLRNAMLLHHVQFIFRHRSKIPWQDFSTLRVVTTDNQILPSSHVYMDHYKHASLPLSTCFKPPHAQFLHEDYDSLPWTTLSDPLVREWQDWLHHELFVNIAPRVAVSIGSALSTELFMFLKSASTDQMLAFFKEYGTDLAKSCQIHPHANKQLRETLVDTSNGQRRALEETYVARHSLARIADLPFLPLEDPNDDCWDFLSVFGVTLQVDCGFYLKRLIGLSQTPPVTTDDHDDGIFEQVKEYYKQLEARFYDGNYAIAIRNAFLRNSLIYLPAQSSPPSSARGRWVSFLDVVWDGPKSMRLRHPLISIYGMFQTFFRAQLKVQDCPSDILVQELQAVYAHHGDAAIDDTVLTRVHHILSDLDGTLEKLQSSSFVDNTVLWVPWLQMLWNVHFVPVREPSGCIQLKGMDYPFYVPDVNEDLATIFRNDVPMLSGPPQKSPVDLLRLHRFLDAEVKKVLVGAASSQTHDLTLSERYQTKVRYITRTITDPALIKSIKPSLLSLRNIAVYQLKSELVNHAYTLGPYIHIKPLPLGVEITDRDCVVLVGKSCDEQRRDSLLCSELARLVPELSASNLYTIFTQPLSIIDTLFPIVDVSMIMGNIWDDPPSEDADCANTNINQIPADDGVLTSSRPSTPTRSTPNRYLVSIPHSTPDNPLSFSRNGWNTPGVRPMDNAEQVEQIGIQGEIYVYTYLQDRLPGFTSLNWTSELRVHMGLPPFTGQAMADFTYLDFRGDLTAMIFGPECWQGRWPTYHLEVKASTGPENAPFHISAQQLDCARRMAPSWSDVYVLVRVSSLHLGVSGRLEASIKMFPQPWHMLSWGSLQITSAVEMAITV